MATSTSMISRAEEGHQSRPSFDPILTCLLFAIFCTSIFVSLVSLVLVLVSVSVSVCACIVVFVRVLFGITLFEDKRGVHRDPREDNGSYKHQ